MKEKTYKYICVCQDFRGSDEVKKQQSIIWKEGVLRKVGHIILSFTKTINSSKTPSDFLKKVPGKMTYKMSLIAEEEEEEAEAMVKLEKSNSVKAAVDNTTVPHWERTKYR